MEGTPVYPSERRIEVVTPPAPPPMEASEIEPFLPLTQPPPKEEVDPQSSEVEASQEPRDEAVRSDDVLVA